MKNDVLSSIKSKRQKLQSKALFDSKKEMCSLFKLYYTFINSTINSVFKETYKEEFISETS